MTYQWTSASLGLVIAAVIFFLIRRDHLHSHHAVWWLAVAGLIAVLGVFPRLVDTLAGYLKINYPPTLLFIAGLALLLIKVISIDIQQSRQERKIRRLTQYMALLEEKLRRHEENK